MNAAAITLPRRPASDEHTFRLGPAMWRVERLWALAAGLPTFRLTRARLLRLDLRGVWGTTMSDEDVAHHIERVLAVDFTHPVIFSAEGELMDGAHRALRAIVEGRPAILAVRFDETPTPDWCEGMTPGVTPDLVPD